MQPLVALVFRFDQWPFLSVHFWGEKAAGTWTLEVTGCPRGYHPVIVTTEQWK